MQVDDGGWSRIRNCENPPQVAALASFPQIAGMERHTDRVLNEIRICGPKRYLGVEHRSRAAIASCWCRLANTKGHLPLALKKPASGKQFSCMFRCINSMVLRLVLVDIELVWYELESAAHKRARVRNEQSRLRLVKVTTGRLAH